MQVTCISDGGARSSLQQKCVGGAKQTTYATMPNGLREADEQAVNSAIAVGSAPRAPPRGRGLLLTVPGPRQGLHIIDDHGTLTPRGTYYYQTTGHSAPNRGFDYSQELVRRGARVQIKLLDGSMATVRTWDGVKRRWRFSKLGQHFYHRREGQQLRLQ